MTDPSYPRRRFIGLALGLTALAPLRLGAAESVADRLQRGQVLRGFLDTLLPADGTASATELGVDRLLLEQAADDPALARLIALGCDWLDQAARRHGKPDFPSLSEPRREALLAEAEQATIGSVPGAFFHTLRHHAFGHYYADPRTWTALGYTGPPQPIGFPDFAEPPKVSGE